MKRLVAFITLACLCIAQGYSANYVLNQELTWDQVKGGSTAFALVSGSEVLYGTNNQNTGMAGASTALNSSNNAVTWKVESTSGGYLFQCYNAAGTTKYFCWEGGYLNAQSSQTGVSFILGKTKYTNGQDMNNGAVWTVTSTSGGYYIKNVGNSAYLNGTKTSASADKVWKFYSVKDDSREDFVFDGYDANPGYTLRPIRQYGKNLVYADDVTHKITLHGVMDTPNSYFNDSRWTISNWNTRYNNDTDVSRCLGYFETLLSACVDHKSGSYCDLFRLHLDPAWTNDPNKTATNGGGENDISRFSADRLRTYMDKLYWPIAKKAIDKGMYVIMRPPGVCPQNISVGDEYQEYLKTVWDIVSSNENVKKYAGQIMIELANEPVNVYDTDGKTNSYSRASVLHDFFQPIVDVIRTNGFKGVVLSSGATWQQSYQGYSSYPITGDNIGYAVHWYPGWYGTNHDKTQISNQTIINNFKSSVPVVESRPIIITEIDWSPEKSPKVVDHTNENGENVYKNYGTWATAYSSSFGKNFKATHDYFGNISMTLTHPHEYVDFDQLFNNNKVTYSYQSEAEPKEACAYTCFVEWYPALYEDHTLDGTSPGPSTSGGSSSTGDLLTTQDDSETDKCTITQTNGVTTYTTISGGVNILFKNKNVDVTGYNQVKITFAEETDIDLIFSTGSNVGISAHSKSFTYDIPSGKTTLDELTIVEAWQGSGKVIKISSIEFLNDDSNTKTITVDGTNRSYYLYIPNGVGENPALVFSLHGASGHSSDFSPFGKAEADSKKCIVVYPQGLDQYFAIFGGNTPGWNATGENNEDIKFFKAIIEDVKNYHAIDTKRIYCCGFSNGGMMTYAAANAASDVFAAFASISGFPMNEFHLRHSGASPRPFLHIHGKEDGFVKYEYMPTIRDNMVARLGANPVATTTTVEGKYTKNVYAAGTNGFPYVYYEIEGMGHSGYTSYTEDNNSTLTMWNFFNQYTLDSECDRTLKWKEQVDASGYAPLNHGWKVVNSSSLSYGDAQAANNTDHNVYHDIQLNAGKYEIRAVTSGTAGDRMTIKFETIGGSSLVNKEITVGTDAVIPFAVSADGQFKLTFVKGNTDDKLNSIAIYEASAAELTGDVDGDGKITISDLSELVRILNSNTKDNNRADVNKDGKIDVDDVNTLVGILLGE